MLRDDELFDGLDGFLAGAVFVFEVELVFLDALVLPEVDLLLDFVLGLVVFDVLLAMSALVRIIAQIG